jgi:hypothetical protein
MTAQPPACTTGLKLCVKPADLAGWRSLMNLPIWVTVVISGFVAGFVGRIVSGLVFLPVILGGTGPHMLADNWALVVLIGGATQAAVTGLVLLVLLPPLSDVRVGFGTTFIAALIGNLISVVGTLVLLRSAVQSNLDAGGGVGMLPAFGLLSLGLTVLGIVVTATIIGGSSAAGGGDGGGRMSLYGGESYLNELRNKGEQP